MGAFNKKVWLARLGVGLNKFLDVLSGKTMQFDSTPDTVTQQGTPLSADNFNDLEGRIESAIDKKMGLLLGSGYYAPADPSGNALTYLRGGTSGFLPYSENAASGSGSVGTSTWPFVSMYAKTFNGALVGNAASATNAAQWGGCARNWHDPGLLTYLYGGNDPNNAYVMRADYFMYRNGGAFTGKVSQNYGVASSGDVCFQNLHVSGLNTPLAFIYFTL